MGDYFQSLADVEINVRAAVEAKSRLTAWLVERQIICAELTDCVLGADGGHAPGANYAHAVGSVPATSIHHLWRRMGCRSALAVKSIGVVTSKPSSVHDACTAKRWRHESTAAGTAYSTLRSTTGPPAEPVWWTALAAEPG